MTLLNKEVPIYLEVGPKRTFACAIDWPGWCRSGKNVDAACRSLFDYGARYAQIFGGEPFGFLPPDDARRLTVVETLPGDTTTDFGSPGAIPAADHRPVTPAELAFFEQMLAAAWQAIDAAGQRAAGIELRKGPRGGGRDLEQILAHVQGGEAAYITALGWKFRADAAADLAGQRQAVLDGLAAALRGEIEPVGPRGGRRWPARYFVRRDLWHILDHLWEIEDRAQPA